MSFVISAILILASCQNWIYLSEYLWRFSIGREACPVGWSPAWHCWSALYCGPVPELPFPVAACPSLDPSVCKIFYSGSVLNMF